MWPVMHRGSSATLRIRLLFDHLAAGLTAYVRDAVPKNSQYSRAEVHQGASELMLSVVSLTVGVAMCRTHIIFLASSGAMRIWRFSSG
jgi:hypothetical protein